MASCKNCRREIEEAAGRGELGREAESHLAACGPCRDFLRERAALVALVGGLGRVSAPDDFDVRLRARMARSRGSGRGHFGFNFRLAPGLAAAAGFVLVFALAAVLFYGRGPSGAGPVARQDQPRQETDATPPASQPSPRMVEVAASSTEDGDSRKAEVASKASVRPRRARVFVRREPVKAAVAGNNHFAVGSARIVVPVGTSSDSMRVVLRNEDGSPRVVPVRSVSFGAQELIASGRKAARQAAKSKEGVW